MRIVRILAASAFALGLAAAPLSAGSGVEGTWAFDPQSVETAATQLTDAMLASASAEERSQMAPVMGQIKQMMIDEFAGKLEFGADGTIVATSPDGEVEAAGTWRLDGDTVEIMDDGENGTPAVQARGTLQGDEILIKQAMHAEEGMPAMPDLTLRLLRQ